MRVRLESGDRDTPLGASLPTTGCVLDPESDRAEWAIVALDQPVTVAGSPSRLLWLRPAIPGVRVGDPAPVPVHVAVVTRVVDVEGRPVYKLGELHGPILCRAEAATDACGGGPGHAGAV